MEGRDRALRITGGARLKGDICVSGSKNAALPEMATALLTSERATLHNVPRVTDTTVMAEIVRELGGRSDGEGSIVLNYSPAVGRDVPRQIGMPTRAPIAFLWALLTRFRQA